MTRLMLEINAHIRIPESEFSWRFVRSGGPGGQNVNKVASKAVLDWDLTSSGSLPEDIKARMRTQQRRRINALGHLLLTSQRYRDQDRNRQDCLEKLRAMVIQALHVPRPRKPTRPTRGSREARLRAKLRRSAAKATRRPPKEDS
jgi:ribosome-associated protein